MEEVSGTGEVLWWFWTGLKRLRLECLSYTEKLSYQSVVIFPPEYNRVCQFLTTLIAVLLEIKTAPLFLHLSKASVARQLLAFGQGCGVDGLE